MANFFKELGGAVLDMIPGIGDARAQKAANETNIELSQENREWMERMSNTAYQRAMSDMKTAGLNPMLAYQQGGASVPTSAAATVGSESKTRLVDSALQAYTGISAAHAQTQNANTSQAQAQSSIALQSAQAAQTNEATLKTKAETAKTIDSIHNQKTQRELNDAQKQLTRAQIPLAKVTESAAGLAQKGVDSVNKGFNRLLQNTAKPSVDPKTLQYLHPFREKFNHKNKKSFIKSGFDSALIK